MLFLTIDIHMEWFFSSSSNIHYMTHICCWIRDLCSRNMKILSFINIKCLWADMIGCPSLYQVMAGIGSPRVSHSSLIMLLINTDMSEVTFPPLILGGTTKDFRTKTSHLSFSIFIKIVNAIDVYTMHLK